MRSSPTWPDPWPASRSRRTGRLRPPLARSRACASCSCPTALQRVPLCYRRRRRRDLETHAQYRPGPVEPVRFGEVVCAPEPRLCWRVKARLEERLAAFEATVLDARPNRVDVACKLDAPGFEPETDGFIQPARTWACNHLCARSVAPGLETLGQRMSWLENASTAKTYKLPLLPPTAAPAAA